MKARITVLSIASAVALLCAMSCITKHQTLQWEDDYDNVHVVYFIDHYSDGKADVRFDLTGEVGRRLGGTLTFDGSKVADIDTLPWHYAQSWSGLSSSLHTLNLSWVAADGSVLSIPYSFQYEVSVHIGR